MESQGSFRGSKPVDPMAQVFLGTGISIAFHPINYTKTLIQLGHEPIPPMPTSTIFGRKALTYPNVYKYLCHIKKTDGFFGLYRGVWARVAGGIVASFTTQSVAKKLKELDEAAPIDEDVVDGSLDDFKRTCKETCMETVSRCSGIIASQPFIVIMTRSMAQFVGRETKYDSILSSLLNIWHEEGILGFFRGLVARLVGEAITIWFVNLLVYASDRYLLQGNKSMSAVNNAACTMIVTQLTYPFQLVSTVMCVSSSSLQAGNPPHMPLYNSWVDCFCALSREGQLKRGSSMFWRYYKGTTIVSHSGDLLPAKQAFR